MQTGFLCPLLFFNERDDAAQKRAQKWVDVTPWVQENQKYALPEASSAT